jgi:hypothetical protein
MLRKVFGCKREKVTGVWRNLYWSDVGLQNLTSSRNITKAIKWRNVILAGNVTHMGEMARS